MKKLYSIVLTFILTLFISNLVLANESSSGKAAISKPGNSTSYTMGVTEAQGCGVTLTATPQGTPCLGQSVNLTVTASGGTGAAPYGYAWAASAGNKPATMAPGTAASPRTENVVYNAVGAPITYTVTVTTAASGGATCTKSVTVNVYDNPIANAGVDTTVCGTQTVKIGGFGATPTGKGTASGATSSIAPFTYSWTSSDASAVNTATSANPTVTPSANTTYNVTVTDGHGCTATDSRVITFSTLSVGVTANPTSVCLGQSTTLTATPAGASNYNWSVGGSTGTTNTKTDSPTATTTYNVTVTDAAGCTGSSSTTVTLNTSLSVTSSNYSICKGQTTASLATGYSAPNTFSWSTNGTPDASITGGNPTVNPTATSTYTVTVTSTSGCTGTAQYIVTVNNPPTAVAGTDATYCKGGTGVTIGGSTGGTCSWSPGTGMTPSTSVCSPMVAPPSTTTYTVTVTDANSCTATDDVVITVVDITPSASASPNQICELGGTTVTLTATPTGATTPTYSWSSNPADGTLAPLTGSATPTCSPTITTTYTVTVSDGSCSGTASTIVNVTSAPKLTVQNNKPTICSGTSTDIVNTADIGGSTFDWTVTVLSGTVTGASASNGSSIAQALTSTTGGTVRYTITPTGPAPSSCKGNPQTVDVVVVPNPVPNVTPNPVKICTGDSTNLGGNNPIDATAKRYKWSVTPTELSLTLTAGNDTIEHPLVKPAVGNYTYTVTVTDVNGCTASDDVVLTVSNNPNPTITANQETCSGVAYTIKATYAGGTGVYSSYNWNPNDNGMVSNTVDQPNLANPTSTQTYTVTVTDDAGCTGSTSGKVTVNPSPVATATNNAPTICSGDVTNITLTADVPSSLFNYTVAVLSGTATGQSGGSGASINQTITNTGAVDAVIEYTITPTGPAPSSCVGAPITVQVTVTATPPAPTVTNVSYCKDDVATPLSAQVTASSFNNLLWYNSATPSPALSGSPAVPTPSTATVGNTDYYVTDHSANGCESPTAKITVTITPNADASFSYSSGTYCKTGGTIQTPTRNDNTGTFSYVLKSGTGPALASFNASTGSFDVATSDEGTYTITYTVGGPCPGTVSKDITITSAFKADFTYTGPYCVNGGKVLPTFINGGTAGTFSMSPSNASIDPTTGEIDLTNATPGTVTITNSIPASGSCAGVTFTATVVINALPAANAGSNATICKNQSVQIGSTAVGSNGYSWTASNDASFTAPANTQSNPTVSPTSTSNYTLTETDPSTGCSNTKSVTVTVNPLPVAPTVANPTICKGTSTTLSPTAPGVTYNWYDATNTSLASNQTTYNTGPLGSTTTFSVEAVSAVGCIGPKTTVTVTVQNRQDSTFSYAKSTYCVTGVDPTPTIVTPGGTFSVSPAGCNINPVTGKITLNSSTKGSYVISYTTAGPCPTVGTFNVVITDAPKANFSYPKSAYCQFESPNPTVTYGAGAGGGVFSARPSMGALNAATGTINLQVPPVAGVYVIKNYIAPAQGCIAAEDSVTVTINVSPNAPNASNVTYCAGATTTPLTATKSDPTYSLIWYSTSTGGSALVPNPPTPNNSPAGTTSYYVSQKSPAGCESARKLQTVTITALPPAPTATNVQYCKGVAASALNGTGTGILKWFGPVSNSTVIGTTAPTPNTNTVGVVNYFVADSANKCLGPKTTVTVTTLAHDDSSFAYPSSSYCRNGGVNPIPTASSVKTSGGTFSLLGAPAGVTINPSTGEIDLNSIAPATPLPLTLTVQYATPVTNSCPTIGQVNVVIISAPKANFHYPAYYCQTTGSNIILPVIPNGTTAGTFSLVSPPTGLILNANGGANTNSPANLYTVRNTVSQPGCTVVTFDTTFEVYALPPASVGSTPAPICLGSTVQIGAPMVGTNTYKWTSTDPNSGLNAGNDTQSNPTLSPAAAGTYTCTLVETTSNNCTSTNNVTFVVNPIPASPSASPVSACENKPVTITISSPATGTYEWKEQASGNIVQTSASKTYSVPSGFPNTPNTIVYELKTTENGCTSPVSTVTVTINPDDNSGISYASTTYCKSYASAVLPTLNTPGIGTVISSSANLVIKNGSTGEIDLANSTPGGPYTITYNTAIPSGRTCPTSSTTTVTITAAPNASFTYKSDYCKSDGTAIPTFTGTAGVFTSNPSGVVFTSNGTVDLNATPAGTYVITNTIAGGSGVGACATETKTFTVKIHPNPVANFVAPANACAPLAATLTAITGSNPAGGIYKWAFSDGTTLTGTPVNKVFDYNSTNNGNYTITLTVVNDAANGSCANLPNLDPNDVQTLKVAQQPSPQITIYNDIVTNLRPNAILIGEKSAGDNTNYIKYNWTYGDGKSDSTTVKTTNHDYPGPGDYTIILTVTTDEGCTGTVSKILNVKEQTEVWIPDAFTPNEDGVNDFFGAKGVSIRNYEMYIYDRWGNLIFQSNDINVQWDGKAYNSGELAQQDVYVYKIIVTDYRGKKLEPFVGKVTLIR